MRDDDFKRSNEKRVFSTRKNSFESEDNNFKRSNKRVREWGERTKKVLSSRSPLVCLFETYSIVKRSNVQTTDEKTFPKTVVTVLVSNEHIHSITAYFSRGVFL